jgi:hypothetical protein
MRRFIKRLGIFLLLSLVVLQIAEYFLPYHYGNKNFSSKVLYFKKHQGKFNTLFIGSSKTDYSVYPPIIDSILSKEGVASFNFGVGGTSNPESYFLAENLVKDLDSTKVKILVLEVSPIRNMSFKNFKTTRNCYYHSLSEFYFSLNVINEEKYAAKKKAKFYFKYGLHFLKDKINFSKLSYLRDPYQYASNIKDENYDGFTSTIIHQTKTATQEDYDRKIKIALNRDSIPSTASPRDYSTHAKRLNAFYESCVKKGIQVFFLVQPKHYDYSYMRAMYHQLPKNSIIDVSDARKFPKLYQQAYSKDPGHLNDKGAFILSKIVGTEIKKRIHQ